MLTGSAEHLRIAPLAAIALLSGCVTAPPAPPIDVYSELADRTAARNMKLTDALEATNQDKCLFLVETAIQAKQGWTDSDDIVNAAKSMDDTIKNMGGNAYDIRAYQWVPVRPGMGTALQVAFGVYLCKPDQKPAASKSSSATL